MAELNELAINGSNYTFEDDVARGLATTETSRAQAAEQSLQTAINNKVDKVVGKGLSANDYTNEEKEKLAVLENYDDTQVRQLITQTNANFANYYTKAESYSAAEVDALLRTQRQGQFVVVSTLPTPSADTMFKIYLVPSTNPETQNVKDEFVTLESNGAYSWEQIGTTAIDLSGYSTTEEMNAAIANALTSYYTKSEIDAALTGKEDTANKKNAITSNEESNTYYPSTKAVADYAEKKTDIVAPVNTTDATLPITTLTCEVGKYYRIDVAVDTLDVTLPAVTDTTHISNIVFMLTTGTTPAVIFTAPSGINVYYQDGFELEAGNTYEINALFNGSAWVIASVEIVVPVEEEGGE